MSVDEEENIETDSEKEQERQQEIESENEVLENDDIESDECEIRAIQDSEKDKEIYNTDGEFPNAVLLLKYGFVIPNNPHDKVALGEEFAEAIEELDHIDKAEVQWRITWWKLEGVDLLEEELEAIEEMEAMADHEQDNDSDQSNEEEEEEEEESDFDSLDEDVDVETYWKDQLYLDSSGEASAYLERLCVILSMSKEQFGINNLHLSPEKLVDVKSAEIKPVLSLALKLLESTISKKKLFKIPEESENLPNYTEMRKLLLIENDIILRAKENFNLE